jgi:hypothetical protein
LRQWERSRCDLTRVVSLQMGQLTTERLGLGAGDVHADYAHDIYGRRTAEDAMTEYGRVHAEHMARILAALDAIPEGNGTLLDNTVVLWMSEMADSWHGFDRYPIVYEGGGGRLKLGQWAHYAPASQMDFLSPNGESIMGKPHQTFLQTLLTAMGEPTNAIGVESVTGRSGVRIDCTGVLNEVLG